MVLSRLTSEVMTLATSGLGAALAVFDMRMTRMNSVAAIFNRCCLPATPVLPVVASVMMVDACL